MTTITTIATCSGNKVALAGFNYYWGIDQVALMITTGEEDDWMKFDQNHFVFDGVVEITGYPLPYDPDNEENQGLSIFEHGEAKDGIRHFSFVHSEARAEMHIKARGFSVKTE
jgi:hypothetical protein